MRTHLIVVVPGIGGSVLALPGRPDRLVWSARVKDVGLVRRPERLSLAEYPALEPVGLIKSLRPVPFWTAVHGYDGLLARLGAPDPTVLAVPYDFRRSIVCAAQLLDDRVRERLDVLWPDQDHTGKVIVVAHSMGGLAARYWLGPGGAAPLCRALITLGTPHWGAPKALDVLVNGIAVKGRHVLTRLRDVLQEWPSMAELLPRYRAVLDTTAAGAGRLLYPHEVDLPESVDAAAAYRVHTQIEQAWERLPRSATSVVARVGYGHGTQRSCTWDGRRVRVGAEAPKWPQLGRWDAELGDGTVPAFSGVPVEDGEDPPDDLLVAYRHGPIADLEQVVELVGRYEGRGSMRRLRGKQRPAVLGLDLGEVQVAGEAFEVSAAVHGTGGGGGGVPVWVSLTGVDAAGAGPVVETALEWDGSAGVFRGQLPAVSPGVYSVRVSAREVPGAGDLNTAETVEVFDDADLG
jgi:hypothetical protein